MPAPAFRPDRIGEGWKPASAYKRSNILRRYCHQRRRKEIDPHYQQYYQGRVLTDVTEHLKPNIPGNPFGDPVFFPYKSTDITELLEKAGKLQKRPVTAPDYSHGIRNTDITECFRILPPAHLGRHPHKKTLPYFGILGSPVTDPSKYVDTSGLPLLSWWENKPKYPNRKMPPGRPQTAPAVVYPQHMSPEVLQKSILERRPYKRNVALSPEEKLCPASEPPSSVRSSAAAGSPRSEVGVKKEDTPRSQLASERTQKSDKSQMPENTKAESTSKKSDVSVAVHSTPRSNRQTPRSESNTARTEKSAKSTHPPASKPPSSKASHLTGAASEDKSSARPPKTPSKARAQDTRTSLSGFPSLTAETLEKLGQEKIDRVTRWAGQLQTWAIPEQKRPPKPVYEERDHSRKKTDVTAGVYIW